MFGPQPPALNAWHKDEAYLHVPRFYGIAHFGPPERDLRTLGDEIELTFTGELTDVQHRAIETVHDRCYRSSAGGGGLICLPCGMGKTVLAVYLITRVLRRKACVLVHKGIIRDQWKACFERFCPNVRVGFIGGKKWDISNVDVTIAMVLTIAKRTFDATVLDAFGTVVADECHHLAAPVMNRAMSKFRARNIVGLTATKERTDGLTPLLHWTLGPEGFRCERGGGERVNISVAVFSDGIAEVRGRDGKPVSFVMLNRLAIDRARNDFIAHRVAQMFRNGRIIMLLSDRIVQLTLLKSLLCAKGLTDDEVGLFHGQTSEASRHGELSKPVVLCSYGMANEGLDKKEADTCVMASPRGNVVQCIGRVQRPCPTKQTPLVLDIVDDVPPFRQQRWTRHRLYTRERYNVQVLNVRTATEGDWFA